jgi:hypothetical protein
MLAPLERLDKEALLMKASVKWTDGRQFVAWGCREREVAVVDQRI